MPEPKADQVAEAAVAALQAVSIGAGYYTDLGQNVTRRRVLLNEVNQTTLPASSVWMGDGEESPAQCMGSFTMRRHLLVETFYRSERREDVDRDGIRHEADVLRAILATENLSSTVTRLVPAGVSPDHQEFADTHLGRRLTGFEVDYNWTADSP